jgi:hypothetical protein
VIVQRLFKARVLLVGRSSFEMLVVTVLWKEIMSLKVLIIIGIRRGYRIGKVITYTGRECSTESFCRLVASCENILHSVEHLRVQTD